jgi:CRISPR-associated exonuclease Cas4
MYSEDDLLMLSALQHLLFCPRQCALIHIEQLWTENRYTVEGRILHERVHTAGRESRGKTRVEYDLPVRSLELGLIGRADVVEFHKQENGAWLPFPVEYKRGRPKKDDSDRVQLCAQALCLEEMLEVIVPCGALYYGKKKRRTSIDFNHSLRETTRHAAQSLHELFINGITPAPTYRPRCEKCSFVELCLPKTLGKQRRIADYIDRLTGMGR